MAQSDDLRTSPTPDPTAPNGQAEDRADDEYAVARSVMVETQLRRRNIKDPAVLEAMNRVLRHEFVPPDLRDRAYEDAPLPIGEGQTISQPYMVAVMAAAAHLTGSERVLEVGTGCGYQAAVLASLAKEVFTIEVRSDLGTAAAERLACLGYANVHVHCGDGTLGLPEFAPYDAIIVAAAAPALPPPLLDQLAEGGRMVVPVGDVDNQELQRIEHTHGTFRTIMLDTCRFVPLVGAHGWKGLSSR